MKTRHRSHPVVPYTASTPRSPAPMGKRNPTGTRMGIKGSDPALYNHNGDIIDTKAIQAEVVRKTQENIAAKAAASQVVSAANSVSDIGAQPHTAEARPIKDVLQDFKKDYGNLPWFRGAGIATGNRLRLMVDGKYKGETPETYKGFGIELVMVDKLRPRKGQSGFTLVELLIAVVVIVILAAVVGGGCWVACGGAGVSSRKANAETYARQYAREFMGTQNPVVSCMGTDTDMNGYVTCSVARAPGEPVRQIECVSNWILQYNKGCREYRLRTIDIQNQ